MVLANVFEVPIYVLGDTWRRRRLLLAGGLAFTLGVLAVAATPGFWTLLVTFALLGTASGTFVNLAQSALVDLNPARAEHNMARWTLAGSVGVVTGTFAVGVVADIEAGWRWLFLVMAGVSAAISLAALRVPVGRVPPNESEHASVVSTLREGLVWLGGALRQPRILGWLVLLELSDLVGDVLLGFAALYFVDVAGATFTEAAVGVGVLTVAGLLGDLMVVVLLERMAGLTYLRLNGVVTVGLLAAFLTVPDLGAKIALGAALGLVMGGRFAILEAQLYKAVPGHTASAHVLNDVSGLIGAFFPTALGIAAAAWGLGAAMWLLMLGPVAIAIGTWRGGAGEEREEGERE